MRFVTMEYQGRIELGYAVAEKGQVFPLQAFFQEALERDDVPDDMIRFIAEYDEGWTDQIHSFYEKRTNLAIALSHVSLLAPIPSPNRNLVCLGKNYDAHAKELTGQIFSDQKPKYPLYFTKPDHTVVGPGEAILLHSSYTQAVDYEVELAIIIGKHGMDIPKEEAEDYIFGYTIANDVSARDLQQNHTQWYKGKSLLTHCPMGPWLVHKSALPFPVHLAIRCSVNGDRRQSANTGEMTFDIPTILSDLSRGYPLRPGDIILTGTPAGVGMGFDPPRFLKSGDLVTCEIEGIGLLENPVL